MSKQQAIEQEGIITEALPNAMFRVQLQKDHNIIAYTSGKMRKFKIKMIPGDKVRIAMSPYDLSRGRIIYRYK